MDASATALADILAGARVEGEHARAVGCPAGSTAGAARVVLDGSGRVAVVPAGSMAPFAGVALERVDGAAGDGPAFVDGPPRRPSAGLVVLHEDARFALARWSLEAGLAFTAGPESERWVLVVAGTGLAFLGPEGALALGPGTLLAVPAGEPVRVWAREALSGVVVQPQAPAAARRTLRSEIERLRREER